MKSLVKTLSAVALIIAAVGGLNACGQKGPLYVEQPPIEEVTTQEEELEETK